MNRLRAVLQAHLEDAGTQWSLGTFGAIAEFMRTPHESVDLVDDVGVLSVSTVQGAMRLHGFERARGVVSETASRTGWNHRVALCLPREECAMARRAVLTELGPDSDAIREQDRNAVLFDLGLDVLQADFCIRTSDPELIAALRAEAGRSIFDPENRAFGAILTGSPHRVFVSRLGRIEVFAPIPLAHGASPEGPHTHVLPDLLRHKRTHPATEPIPPGWVPCAHLYPAHPVRDALGRPRPFDRAAHDSFQAIFAEFGDPSMVRLKSRILAALHGGASPGDIAIPDSRAARNVLRVTTHQWRAMTEPAAEKALERLPEAMTPLVPA